VSLIELTVRDLALAERIRIRFAPGFTVISGETGAGKSLLIDALTLALGGRADAAMVRHGAEAAIVEAVFEAADLASEPLVVRREVSAAGRSLVRIDDAAATVGRLAEMTGPLVEIHGQHDQQRLLSTAAQRDLLDAFGGHSELWHTVSEAVGAWRANADALAALELDPAEVKRRIELRAHVADEVEAASIRVGEVDELRGRLAASGHAERLTVLTAEAHANMVGEGEGARDRLALAGRAVSEAARLDARFGSLGGRLTGLEAEVADAAEDLRHLVEAVDHDPSVVLDIEARLGLLYGLIRKYGVDEATVLAEGERARADVERLSGLEGERRARAEDDRGLRALADEAAGRLTGARRSAAGRLSAEVSGALADLGFGSATFDVAVLPAELDASGTDTIIFQLAPNPGEPALALARIASGGELSRVALAIKRVLAAADATPTLVFDEIDAGVGGRSAEPIGRMLADLAADHQVICVTHLPQIAAYADTHLRIAKATRDGRTVTSVETLDADGRLAELAAMLGDEAGAGAAAAARELAERADRRRPASVGAA
jgi:DNA repair protein RecN (Recombination protein N)